MTACELVINDKTIATKREEGWYVRTGGGYKVDGRYESDLTAVDPVTLEIRKSLHLAYPNYSGTLATAGGLVFLALLDGTVAAFDDTSLEQLWKDQCWVRLCSTANDIRGQRQTIRRGRIGTQASVPEQACPYAGTQGAAQRDRAVCLRLVRLAVFDCFFCTRIPAGAAARIRVAVGLYPQSCP